MFGFDGDGLAEAFFLLGDSPHDSPMFEFFPNAVGVANVLAFNGRMPALPRWVTRARASRGFAELADLLLEARQPHALTRQ